MFQQIYKLKIKIHNEKPKLIIWNIKQTTKNDAAVDWWCWLVFVVVVEDEVVLVVVQVI